MIAHIIAVAYSLQRRWLYLSHLNPFCQNFIIAVVALRVTRVRRLLPIKGICAQKYARLLTACILPFSFLAFVLKKISRVFPLLNARDRSKSPNT